VHIEGEGGPGWVVRVPIIALAAIEPVLSCEAVPKSAVDEPETVLEQSTIIKKELSTVREVARAVPILGIPSLVSRMLAALRSRCMIFWECRYSRPLTTHLRM
jgi:hypothetical protein